MNAVTASIAKQMVAATDAKAPAIRHTKRAPKKTNDPKSPRYSVKNEGTGQRLMATDTLRRISATPGKPAGKRKT